MAVVVEDQDGVDHGCGGAGAGEVHDVGASEVKLAGAPRNAALRAPCVIRVKNHDSRESLKRVDVQVLAKDSS